MKFNELSLRPEILSSLEAMGFADMTEIQERCIPILMEGKDIIGQSMTGSGKTAAFGVPIVQRIEKDGGLQALIVVPTRELAVQVAEHMKKFSHHLGLRIALVFGGVSLEPQTVEIRRAHIVVGTPGRILDHMRRGSLRLHTIRFLVLDEGDRMLDMGFIDDIRMIISQTPVTRQTMLFSATMPDPIVAIARTYLKDPVKIKTQPQVSTHLLKHFYYDVNAEDKLSLLVHLIKKEDPNLAIVFCAMRHVTDTIERALQQAGIRAHAIHGGLTQARRLEVLERFQNERINILVATDVAARGLDITNVSHIFNYDIPESAEDYTHRVGRTARFGKSGKAISLLSKRDHEAFRRIVRHIDIDKAEPEKFEHLPFYAPRERTREERMIGRKRPGWGRGGGGRGGYGSSRGGSRGSQSSDRRGGSRSGGYRSGSGHSRSSSRSSQGKRRFPRRRY